MGDRWETDGRPMGDADGRRMGDADGRRKGHADGTRGRDARTGRGKEAGSGCPVGGRFETRAKGRGRRKTNVPNIIRTFSRSGHPTRRRSKRWFRRANKSPRRRKPRARDVRRRVDPDAPSSKRTDGSFPRRRERCRRGRLSKKEDGTGAFLDRFGSFRSMPRVPRECELRGSDGTFPVPNRSKRERLRSIECSPIKLIGTGSQYTIR